MYVWFFKAIYHDALGPGRESYEWGRIRTQTDCGLTAMTQLCEYLGEGYKVLELRCDGEIADV